MPARESRASPLLRVEPLGAPGGEPAPALQDRVLAEACRVLRPGGVLAGTDSLGGGLAFRLAHIGDTFVRVAPEGLADRLRAAGFADPRVETAQASVRFVARKPG